MPDENPIVTHPTGASREQGANDWTSMSYIALRRLTAIYTEGAERYGTSNWRKGLPYSDTVNHLMEHLTKWLSGDRSEDHLAKVAWGAFTLMEHEKTHPEMDDLTEVKKPRRSSRESLRVSTLNVVEAAEELEITSERTKVVAAIIHSTLDNSVLLVKSAKPWFLGWHMPGGKVKHGEASTEALRRELKEELDFTFGNYQFQDLQCALYTNYRHPDGTISNNEVNCFYIRLDRQFVPKLNGESTDARWLPAKKFYDGTLDDLLRIDWTALRNSLDKARIKL